MAITFRKKLARLFIAAVALCGCQVGGANWPYSIAPDYPFGMWRSGSGYTIEVRRDGTYRVCGAETCDDGSVERVGEIGLTLKDFDAPEHDVARALLDSSGYRQRWLRGRSDLDFTPNMGPPANAAHCAGRPCVALGDEGTPEYTFILQR